MKIIDLHIYGFGQLENVKIDSLNDHQIFFGENEAGKSTLMAFIHGILFGFPTKQQSEIRYEPKQNAKYGGKIRIHSEDYGFAVIERVKGKSAVGDVSVSLENGTLGGEELLRQLLLNVDKGLFQAIFSFNLHGIQNIHHMKREEIGKFLFSAGTVGSDRLSIAEIELQKELDTRFKRGGKKPSLNEKLLSLHHFNDDLKKAAGKNQEYESIVSQRDSIQKELVQIREELHELEKMVSKIMEWKKIQPLVLEEKRIEKEMEEQGIISFPAHGLERIEKFTELILPYNAQISSLLDRIEKLKIEILRAEPNQEILNKELELMEVLEKIPLDDQLKFQEKQDETKLAVLQEKLLIIKEKLHLSLEDEEILLINTNMHMKDQVEELSSKEKSLAEMKQQLEERFNDEKKELEELEEHVRYTRTQMIPEPKRQELERKVSYGSNRKTIEKELILVQEKIELYRQVEEQDRAHTFKLKKQNQLLFVILSILCIGLIIFGWFSKQSSIIYIACVGLIFFGIWLTKLQIHPKRKKIFSSISDLLNEEKRLVKELESPVQLELSELQSKLALDNRLREELHVLNIKLEQQQQQYDKVILKFEQWEWEAAKHREKIIEVSLQLKIPENIAKSYLLEAFQYIEQYKSIVREKQFLQSSIKNLKTEREELTSKLRHFANQFLKESDLENKQVAFMLKSKLKDELEKSIQHKEKYGKLQELSADLEQLTKEQKHIEGEIKQLLQTAKAEDENQFYQLGEKAKRQEKLCERLKDIQSQLQFSSLSKEDRERFLHLSECEEILTKYQQEILTLKAQLKVAQEDDASIKLRIQIMEEGGVYSGLLHQFKQKKYELEEEAKDWAVYRVAQDLLAQTIEKYKNIHLPRMISKAEAFLSYLTDGNYQRIIPQPSGTGFLVERIDHTIFEANELSQATTEQVYVSIRLALATTLYEKYRFPIIIDDSFVNFDARRTQKVMDLLKQLKHNQILFFTCHVHLLDYFSQDQIINLQNGSILECFRG